MSQQVKYSKFKKSDFDSLLKMASKLLSDTKKSELRRQLKSICALDNHRVYMARTAVTGKRIGFSIFSIRHDYVEGARMTPTGYLEAIYIKTAFRKQGVARQFIQIGENWLKKNRCKQIGSDTWLTDKNSRKFHKKLGFWEEDELVHFLKNLK